MNWDFSIATNYTVDKTLIFQQLLIKITGGKSTKKDETVWLDTPYMPQKF